MGSGILKRIRIPRVNLMVPYWPERQEQIEWFGREVLPAL